MKQRREIIISLGLAILIGISFSPGVFCGFVDYDDNIYVTDNPVVQQGLSIDSFKWAFVPEGRGTYNPLTWLSLLLDTTLFGVHPSGYHGTNIALHMASSILLLLLLRRTTGSLWGSAAVAALFAVHPLRVESVIWISERKDTLSVFFALLTLLAYVTYTKKPGVVRYLWVFSLFTLGLLAKPMLVTLPAIMVLFDIWPLQRVPLSWLLKEERKDALARWRKVILEKVPLAIPIAFSTWATFIIQIDSAALKPASRYPFSARFANVIDSYFWYVKKLFIPTDLACFYPFVHNIPIYKTLLISILMVVVTAILIRQVKKRPYLAIGWLFWIITLLPVIGIIQTGDQSHADRYTYLTHIGLLVMLVWAARELAQRFTGVIRITIRTVGVIVLAMFSYLTWMQSWVWKDNLSLFSHAVEVTKDNYLAHNGLGLALLHAGRLEESRFHLQTAITLMPPWDSPRYNMVLLEMQQGKHERALRSCLASIAEIPPSARLHALAGRLYLYRDNREMAEHYLRQALALKPNDRDANALAAEIENANKAQ